MRYYEARAQSVAFRVIPRIQSILSVPHSRSPFCYWLYSWSTWQRLGHWEVSTGVKRDARCRRLALPCHVIIDALGMTRYCHTDNETELRRNRFEFPIAATLANGLNDGARTMFW